MPSKYVGYRTKIKVITTDASQNPILYPGSPILTTLSASTSPEWGKEYLLDQPHGATNLVIDVEIETRDCGWPVNGGSATPGYGGYNYMSPLLQYPVSLTVYENNFKLFYQTPC